MSITASSKLFPLVAACFFLTICFIPAGAADGPPAAADIETVSQSVLTQIRSTAFETMPRNKPTSRIPAAAQAEAFVGREDLLLKAADAVPNCAGQDQKPLSSIVERARRTSIVIVNEDHASPRDRQFIGTVLKALRPEGYSVYAAETFSMYETLVHEGVLGSDGWYSNEPMFGRTIALAKALGYSLVAYEQTDAQADSTTGPQASQNAHDRREQNQTANLMSAIFHAKPTSKVIIHVGHSHVRERQAPWSTQEETWMAQLLKVATGIDPLTISQIDCVSPFVADVISESRTSTDTSSPVDIFVGHPALTFENSRPAWRRSMGDLPVDIPQRFSRLNERIIVEARPLSSTLGTVPVDRILLYPGESLPLLLPPGRYRIDGFTQAGLVPGEPTILHVK